VNRSSLWVVAYDPKTFRLESLEVTIVGVRSVAPDWGCSSVIVKISIIPE